jgi:hypothetical protein
MLAEESRLTSILAQLAELPSVDRVALLRRTSAPLVVTRAASTSRPPRELQTLDEEWSHALRILDGEAHLVRARDGLLMMVHLHGGALVLVGFRDVGQIGVVAVKLKAKAKELEGLLQ